MTHYKGAASEGGRAINLLKKRQKEIEEIEVRKKRIEDDLKIGSIQNKFATHYDAVEQQLKSDTVGLLTLDEMKAKQEDVIRLRETQLAKKDAATKLEQKQSSRKIEQERIKKSNLSFDPDGYDDEDGADIDYEDRKGEENIEEVKDEEYEVPKKRKRFGKNPEVDTSYLPDRDREDEENKLRENLRREWAMNQELIKNEEIAITYSYWDGSGHRRQVTMKKGNSIQQFLQKCLESLRKEFNDLKTVSVDQLMFIKEDLILPQHYTFYDFLVTKARGKSGALFTFDVYEDVRITNDHRISKDESHAGKICMRQWYERNKHIFPASRWEPFDPEKKWDHYTVSDKNSAKITVK